MSASPTRPSRSSTGVRGSRATPVRPTAEAIPRSPIICRAPTAATVSGRRFAAGEKIGPSAAAFFQAVIAARPHPEQGFRTCLGSLLLTRSYDNARVDAACRRGILIKARSVASIRSILKNGLDRAFLDETSNDQPLRHRNIRGQGYFH